MQWWCNLTENMHLAGTVWQFPCSIDAESSLPSAVCSTFSKHFQKKTFLNPKFDATFNRLYLEWLPCGNYFLMQEFTIYAWVYLKTTCGTGLYTSIINGLLKFSHSSSLSSPPRCHCWRRDEHVEITGHSRFTIIVKKKIKLYWAQWN